MAAVRIRALTARPPIKLTSPRCLSAWQPNLGRGSTYRCGESVQTTGPSSQNTPRLQLNGHDQSMPNAAKDENGSIQDVPAENFGGHAVAAKPYRSLLSSADLNGGESDSEHSHSAMSAPIRTLKSSRSAAYRLPNLPT